ncbi:MAG: sensor histidine kinase [Thermodesulfobacteriota bacterium]
MSFGKRLSSVRHTLAFRLTLWYASLFMVSSCVAFFFFYLLITLVVKNQTDQDLLSSVQTISSIYRLQGMDAVRRQAVIESQAAGEKKIFFRFLYPNGTVFSSSNITHWRGIDIGRAAVGRLLETGNPVFEDVNISGQQLKVRLLYAVIGPGIIVQLGRSMEAHDQFLVAFRKMFMLTMASLFVLAVLIGWFLARRALVGVERVSRTAQRISAGSLKERVPVGNKEDEIDQLALTFNQMLDRIQTLVDGIKEMSDNIAHDLKSPVTRIRGLAEVTLTSGSSMGDYEQMAASTVEECDRLLEMINTMLLISRTEAGAFSPHRQPMDLSGLVANACDLFQSVAEDKGIAMSCELCRPAEFMGDVRLLQRMVANLLDNAIQYTESGGRIAVRLESDPEKGIRISVTDTGIGVSEKALPRIFERFYRADPSRSESGTGLGLSFARAVARAHGGDILAESTPGKGSCFTVHLPLIHADAPEVDRPGN